MDTSIELLFGFFLAMFVTITLIPLFKRLAYQMNVVDTPNERKIHVTPMPRTGGISMVFGIALPFALWAPWDPFLISTVIGATLLIIVGCIDDIVNLSYRIKFFVQTLAALCVIIGGGVSLKSLPLFIPIFPAWIDCLTLPMTFLLIVGVTNAINLADGLDGLAGGIALLIFICLSFLAFQCEHYPVFLISVCVSGAILGFLRYNTYPATIFMGDTGSQLLGFLAITFAIELTRKSPPLSAVLPVILLGFPILDTLAVMTERILKGRSPFKADQNHFHHKLMRLGFKHKEAVFIIYLLQSIIVTSAYIFRFHAEVFLLAVYTLISALILIGLTQADRRKINVRRLKPLAPFFFTQIGALTNKAFIIPLLFLAVDIGISLSLLRLCLWPKVIPAIHSWVGGGILFCLAVTLAFKKEWLPQMFRFAFFIIIPFLVYLVPSRPSFYPLVSYALIFIGTVMVLIISRRRKQGFQATPMDFIIMFLALVAPNLPDDHIQNLHFGMFTAKIIVFYFGYDILIGESRQATHRLWSVKTILAAACIILFRGLE